MSRTKMAEIGPCAIDLVPLADFRKFRLPEEVYRGMWHIVGPSAELNMRKHPIWRVICMAYMEGLYHGSELARENSSREAAD